jgi:hypothetical protein
MKEIPLATVVNSFFEFRNSFKIYGQKKEILSSTMVHIINSKSSGNRDLCKKIDSIQ